MRDMNGDKGYFSKVCYANSSDKSLFLVQEREGGDTFTKGYLFPDFRQKRGRQ